MGWPSRDVRRDVVFLLGAVMPVAAALAAAVGSAAAQTAPPTSGRLAIAFMGDSMVDGVWGGVARLVSKDPCLVSKVRLLRFGENGTGLTRPAKYDWIAQARTILQQQQPTITLISIGLNDRQSIVDLKRHRFDLGTPAWRTKYGELALTFAKAAAASPAGVLWLGIPVLRDPVSQQDAAEKNAVVADALGAAKDPRIVFVEAWHQGASAAQDAFQPFGKSVDGSRVQLRAPDGTHFTSAGYDAVARYIFPKIVDQLKANKVELGLSCGTRVDAN